LVLPGIHPHAIYVWLPQGIFLVSDALKRGIAEHMNSRGFGRGVIQRPPPRAVRQSPSPRHRPLPGQPPQPARPGDPGYQQLPWPAQPPIGTTTAPAVQAATPPVAWQRPVRRIALDSLEVPSTEAPPEFSWRRLLTRLTGIRLGPSRSEIHELELRDRARAPLGSAFPVAVLNLKDGVGKTSVVEALGSTFADGRKDRVIAVDVDAGDIAERHGYKNQLTLLDLLANRSVTRYPDVRAYTRRNRAGLELLALPNYSDNDWLIERDDVLRAFSILRNHYSVVLMDCCKVLKSAVTEAVLLESRALVVVTNASVDAIEKTRTTIEWLSRNGYQRQLESTVLAINHTERGKPSVPVNNRLQQLSDQFAPKRVVNLPFDRHVHEGQEIILERLGKRSRRGYLEMAAALADMFPRRGIGTPAH
jgi:MinD-like ATPase involved in chromosome partitioning or flagellar assembly